MAENSVLQTVMLEEYDRLIRLIDGIESELVDLPKGYISKKIINNNEYYYLQWRDGKKVKSKHISAADASKLQESVKRRQDLEKSLRSHKKDKRRLEIALGKDFIKDNIG